MSKTVGLLIVLAAMVTMLVMAANADVRRTNLRLLQAADLKRQPAEPPVAEQPSSNLPVYLPVGAVTTRPAIDSRGAVIAQTYNDVPANVGAGRLVATNPPDRLSPQPAGVHFAIVLMDAPSGVNRMGYSCYDPLGGGTYPIPGGKVILADPGSNEGGGSPKIMALPDGRAIVSGQSFEDASVPNPFFHVAKDLAPFSGEFGDLYNGSIMDVATNQSGNFDTGYIRSLSPFSCLDINGSGPNDTVIYVWTTGGTNRSLLLCDENKVFRKFGTSMPGVDTGWTLVFVDSGNGLRGGGIASDPTSARVAVFTTLSPTSDMTGGHGLDVRWADSPTGNSGTWTKHNLTNITPASLDIPWLEVDGMFDSHGKLHLIFNATYNGDGQTFGSINCRGLHWSEHDPSRWYVFYDARWPLATICGRNGYNVMNIGQMSIGECEDRLYIVYSAANDPNFVPNGDDCVASQTAFTVKGNGEIYLTVSSDLAGRSWDRPRDVSNSYTPDCDTGTCASDMFPSLSLYGIDDADFAGTEDWTNAQSTWDPSGGAYTGSKYLQVYYLQDRYPSRAGATYTGGIVPPWTLNDMRWVRMACAAPIKAANLTLARDSITWPEWHKPGDDTTFKIILSASGNSNLTFSSIMDIEDSAKGPGAGPTGWMSLGAIPSMVPEGGTDSIDVTLNVGGIITSGPTVLFGKVRFSFTPPAQTKDLIIQFPVADTVALATWDTISTSCLDLAVGTDGSMGHGGGFLLNVQNGRVNMDYVGHGDCDTGSNSRGRAEIYLFSGSPMIIRQTGLATNRGSWSWSTWSSLDPTVRFQPVSGFAPHGAFSSSSYDGFNSGTFVTVDSLVKVEETWWAPTHADSCNFIVQRMRVFPANIGSPVTNLQIGEAIDWDIPTDTFTNNFSTCNISGTDPNRKMAYMRGYDMSDGGGDCADNSKRYGGMALLNWFMKNKTCYDSLYGASTFANDAYAYPGITADSMSRIMHISGYALEPAITDVTALLTFKDGPSGFTLPANDTLTIFTALATTKPNARSTNAGLDSLKKAIDKARNFMKTTIGVCASCCQGKTGNVNMTGIVDLSDLSALVSYLTGGGYVLSCPAAANVNAIGIVDLSDLSALVSYLTGGGYVLPNCP